MSYKYKKTFTEEIMSLEDGTNIRTVVTYSAEYNDSMNENKKLKDKDTESELDNDNEYDEDEFNSISDTAALKINIKTILTIIFLIGVLSLIWYNRTHIMDNMVVYLFIIGIYIISKLCRVVYKYISNLKIKVE